MRALGVATLNANSVKKQSHSINAKSEPSKCSGHSGAGTIFQQGGQDQLVKINLFQLGSGGAVRPQRGPGQSPGGKRILTTIF